MSAGAAGEDPFALRPVLVELGLPDTLAPRLAGLVELIARDPLAPTTVRDPTAIVEHHVADSLVAWSQPALRSATALVDIGSGAGLPGLPLALALPHARVTLLESNRRKCAFIARATDVVRAENVSVVPARAEGWPAGIDAHDAVTARALAPLDVLVEYAAPLLRIGGALVAWRGQRDPDAEAAADRAAARLGLAAEEPIRVTPFRGAEHRHLHVIRKVAETPPGYPRREGAARKRPLGAMRPSDADRTRR